MIDLYSLVKDTSAYLTIKGEKESGRLSHAYLILTADGQNLREYLKIFAIVFLVILAIIKHKENIKRLIKGEERKLGQKVK